MNGLIVDAARLDTFVFQHPKLAKVSRRFLIVEGIYMNQGTLCNIEEMIQLKRK